jgi:hypothetical protein
MNATTSSLPMAAADRPPWALLLTGSGLAWLAKLAVIAMQGPDSEGGFIAVFYFLGVGLLLIGCAALAWALVDRAHIALRVLASLGGAFAAIVLFIVLDGVLPVFGPDWFEGEQAIFATALVALAAGLYGLSSRSARRA